MKKASVEVLQRWFTPSVAERLLNLDRVVLSLSGGVDSSVMLLVLAGIMKPQALKALMFRSFLHFAEEQTRAAELCHHLGIPLVEMPGPELDNPELMQNVPSRCALCKEARLEIISQYAKAWDALVIDGTNSDDVKDPTRLGNQVLARCEGLWSPLVESGFSKAQVRALGRELGLPWADEAATACLATRFPPGALLTEGTCRSAGEAEQALKTAGFDVRVRVWRQTICLEFPPEKGDEMRLARRKIVEILKPLGYQRIMVDLEGYQTGRTWLDGIEDYKGGQPL